MAFSQGVSGLNAAASQLDTIGNNIANSQTVGYKNSRTEFADIYAGAKAGLGTKVAAVTQNFNSGSLETTNRDLDLAIDGGGFFRLTDGNQVSYSRNGQFQMDSEGYLVSNTGQRLTGYNVQNFNSLTTDPSVATGGTPEAIQVPSTSMIAKGTSEARGKVALDAGSEIRDPANFDPNDVNTYSWSTTNTVYDSLGNAQSLNLYFVKDGSNSWQVNAEMPLGSEANWSGTVAAGGTYPGGFDPTASGNGTFNFADGDHNYRAVVTGASQDAGGAWSGGEISYTETQPSIQLSFNGNGVLTQADQTGKPGNLSTSQVQWSFDSQNGSAETGFSFDFNGATQTAKSFSIADVSQNGNAPGDLTGISIDDDGTINGNYSNGRTVGLGRVALADFANEQGLSPIGNNQWVATTSSGQELLGTAGTGQLGNLLSGTLEQSNVDLSQELVNMIVSQRNYQANAQTIKTQDQILQTAVSLR
ncbi:flagellar hook protein FlgE [Kushneria phosphatilytica]|uniref:Flagellar hook protein FlgE n=1 Tax=Kushneria phosphatilytica TaxID=657387 RepID=A0A1S1NWS3_9GAMM|nr:flagellar hook protein FlgE [Kushneria phosphatilytica]OHV12022.1 hypothetical protein BH688_04985 [Kushneria phosphatilytica]QEL11215.1 flagellar hook protein FlgE [Kushneria phosphatilytica]